MQHPAREATTDSWGESAVGSRRLWQGVPGRIHVLVRNNGRLLAQCVAGPRLGVGDDGELPLPGVEPGTRLVEGDRIAIPDGWWARHVDAAGSTTTTTTRVRVLGIGERMWLRPAEDHALELEIVADATTVELDRSWSWLPTRETAIAAVMACCLAAWVGVDVAVSPLRRTAHERIEPDTAIERAVYSITVPPPPSLPTPELPWIDEPAPEDPPARATSRVEAAPPSVASNALPDVAAPKKKRRTRRAREQDAVVGVLSSVDLIGSLDGASGILGGTAEITAFGVREDLAGGETFGVAGGVVIEEVVTEPPTPVVGAPLGDADDPLAPAGVTACKASFAPKPQLELRWVVDATAAMAPARTALAGELARLHRVARTIDPEPRHELMTFAQTRSPLRSVTVAALQSALREPVAEVFGADGELGVDGIDALAAALARPWGPARETLRVVVVVSDSPWISTGTAHDWDEIADRVRDDEVRLVVIGDAGIERLERGDGDEPLWARSGGLALPAGRLRAGRLELADELADLLRNPVCETTLLERIVDDR